MRPTPYPTSKDAAKDAVASESNDDASESNDDASESKDATELETHLTIPMPSQGVYAPLFTLSQGGQGFHGLDDAVWPVFDILGIQMDFLRLDPKGPLYVTPRTCISHAVRYMGAHKLLKTSAAKDKYYIQPYVQVPELQPTLNQFEREVYSALGIATIDIVQPAGNDDNDGFRRCHDLSGELYTMHSPHIASALDWIDDHTNGMEIDWSEIPLHQVQVSAIYLQKSYNVKPSTTIQLLARLVKYTYVQVDDEPWILTAQH